METKINVKFMKINGFKVDDKLLKANPTLETLTKQTVEILCVQIEKYFKDNHIEVKTAFEMK